MDHAAGVTWVDGELWCGTWDGDDGERRQLDPCTGEVMQTLDMPRGAVVSGRESDGAERFFCGNARGARMRVLRRPRGPAPLPIRRRRLTG
jgi:hypothetical protein